MGSYTITMFWRQIWNSLDCYRRTTVAYVLSSCQDSTIPKKWGVNADFLNEVIDSFHIASRRVWLSFFWLSLSVSQTRRNSRKQHRQYDISYTCVHLSLLSFKLNEEWATFKRWFDRDGRKIVMSSNTTHAERDENKRVDLRTMFLSPLWHLLTLGCGL